MLCFAVSSGRAQVVTECPQNIGFEAGTLNNWECYAGQISGTGERFPGAIRPPTLSMNFSGPVTGQHTVIRRSSDFDAYGNFSLNAPNGSEYVVQLGNDITGRGTERISYTINPTCSVYYKIAEKSVKNGDFSG